MLATAIHFRRSKIIVGSAQLPGSYVCRMKKLRYLIPVPRHYGYIIECDGILTILDSCSRCIKHFELGCFAIDVFTYRFP